MAHRTLHEDLEASLIAHEAFSYAHLVKFEKPINTATGYPVKAAKDYAYISDGSFDMTWDDDSLDINGVENGPQVYIANRLLRVGSVKETIQARASSINLEISAVALNTTLTSVSNVTATTITAGVSLVDAGFSEGDTIRLTGSANNNVTIRFNSFSNDNKTAAYTAISVATLATGSASYTYTFDSKEVVSMLADSDETGYAGYINREVFIYKAHIRTREETIDSVLYPVGSIIGAPYLLFKGIIATGKLAENTTKSSKVTWSLTSHWGDFVRINGRLTSDGEHRALNGEGQSDKLALLRPEYGSDLGFMHSEQAVNLVANYNVMVTKTKLKTKRNIIGMKSYKQVEYQEEEAREVDLRFNLDAKRLPVIYGVQRTQSFPVFVDTLFSDSNIVYIAYAICEGEIGGLYDVYIEDESSICIDANDLATRGAGSTTAEVICTGRMERGDTMAGRDISTNTDIIFAGVRGSFGSTGGTWNMSGWAPDGINPLFLANKTLVANASVGGGVTVGAAGGGGITHGKGTTIEKPLPMKLTMHTGKPFQKSDDTLSSIAAGNNFKIQRDYYEGTGDYWGPQHRLLDTAYATVEYTIGEGETTIPELDFIVRGKVLDCYDYDHSYIQDAQYSGTSESTANFTQGDLVTIKRTGTTTTIDTARIADITSYKNTDNVEVFRVRFTGLTLGDDTAFFMTDDTNEYHFVTYDHTYVDSSVPYTLTAATAFTDVSSGSSINAVFSTPSTALQEAVAMSDFVSIIDNADLAGAVEAIIDSMGNTFTFTPVYGALTDIGGISGASQLPATAKVIIKDCIQLSSGSSPDNNKYNNLDIEVTRKFNDNTTHTQRRRITDYDGGTRVAKVDRPFDDIAVPQAGDAFKIYSLGDKRISTNPVMQTVDYLTNKQYGRGLDVADDLNVAAFQLAARECDTRSDVTLLLADTNIAVNDIYKLSDTNGICRFMGTVKSTPVTVTIGGTAYDEVTFTDVIGKVASKWADYRVYQDGEYVWHNGKIYEKEGAGSITSAPTAASDSVNALTKVSGTGPDTIAIEVVQETFEGNPIVKKYNSTTASFGTGYSLYDCDNVKYWRYLGWDAPLQSYVTRHQTNCTIATTSSVFENINGMLAHFNGILRYVNGKYDIVVKTATDTYGSVQSIGDDDIIGQIGVEDAGQKGTFNSVSVSIPDPQSRYKSRSVNFFNSNYLKEDRNIPRKGTMKTPYISNYYNARINAKQYLEESRKGLKVAFKMEPKGLLLTAGSLIKITNSRLGWVDHLFRISNLTFSENCLVNVTAEEHSPLAFLISPIESTSLAGTTGGVGTITIVPPTNLSIPADSLKGGARLTWTNSAKYNPFATHVTEIWRATTNSIASATLIDTIRAGIASGPAEYTDAIVTGADTFYYWIRYSVVNSGTASKELYSVYVGSVSATTTDITDGVTGASVDILFKRSATEPAKPTAANLSTWETDVASLSGTALLWASKASKAEGSSTWAYSDPYQVEGTAVAEIYIYRKNSSAGSTGGSYNFTNSTLTVPTDWATTPPTLDANNDVVYVAVGLFSGSPTETAATTTWSTPVIYSRRYDGVDGAVGTNTATVYAYKRSSSTLAASNKPDTARTWTFATGTWGNNALGNSWTGVIPSGTDDIYFCAAVSAATTATDSVAVVDWSAPQLLSANGVNTAPVFAYTRSTSNPNNKPSSARYYTFSTGVFNDTDLGNSWKSTVESLSGTDNLYVCTAIASSSQSTDEVVASDWSSASLLAASGDDGTPGVHGLTLVMSNESHVLPTTAGGTVTYTGSGTTIKLFEGTTELIYDGTGSASSRWRVTASAISITAGGLTASGNYVTVADHTSMNANNAQIVYNIIGKRADGSAISFGRIQSFSKSTGGADGSPGAAGNNTAVVYAYQRSASVLTTKPDTARAWTFATGTWGNNALGDSWSGVLPSGTADLYFCAAVAQSTGASDTVEAGDWSSPQLLAASGSDGAAGMNTAPVFAYKRAATTPGDKPGTTVIYTFATGLFSSWGNNTTALGNSWHSVVPTGTGNLYVCTAIVASTGTTDTVVAADWSSAQLLASNGTDGDTGPSGFLYYFSGTNSTAASEITASSPATGQIAIVENTSGVQAGYRYSGSAWVAKALIDTGIIVADAIKSEQLEISSHQGNDRIHLDGTNNVIKVYAGGNVRVKIGDLS